VRVLVTSARSPHALAAIREFGRRGWEVSAADCTRLAPGLHSRWVGRRLVWPSVTERPGEWIDACLRELGRGDTDLLFPTFEETFLVSRFRDALSRHAAVLVDDYDKLLRVHHKVSLNAVARDAGVDVPETWQPADEADLARIRDRLPYPVVLKLPDANNSRGLAFCDDADALARAWRDRVAAFGPATDRSGDRAAAPGPAADRAAPSGPAGDDLRLPVIQRRVDGDVLYGLFLADRGRTVGALLYEPLLMFPDGGGTAFHRRSVRNAAVEEASARLIRALEWHGFLGLDFIVERGTGRDRGGGSEPATGRPLLIDANPRTTPALLTGQAAGVDFVGMAIDLARGGRPEPQVEPVPGVRTKLWFVHWLWFSFQILPGRGWWRRVRAAFASLRIRGFVPDVHRRDDPRPSLFMALFVPWFLFAIDALKGPRGGPPRGGLPRGGFMYGCNYDRATADRAGPGGSGGAGRPGP